MTANFGVVAVAVLELVPAQRQRFLDDDVGQFGQVVGKRLDGLQAGEVLRQQAEDLRVVHFAQDVHLALGVAGVSAPGCGAGLARKPAQSVAIS